jgi:hypothetical protein
MRKNIRSFQNLQVFLNYPFDDEFSELADAISFAVVAGGLIPVCAYDLTTPDRLRLEMLFNAISCCDYSVHDLSRSNGLGEKNFARMNMPIEMGMALYHALFSQKEKHKCMIFVPNNYEYTIFASDLAGLDPKVHDNDDVKILGQMYDWLRDVVEVSVFNSKSTHQVIEKYADYKIKKKRLKGGSGKGVPTHSENRELMYEICSECGWWDIRSTRGGQSEFPIIPIEFDL